MGGKKKKQDSFVSGGGGTPLTTKVLSLLNRIFTLCESYSGQMS